MASGISKMVHKDKFPYQIGLDVAGTVIAVGSGVTNLKPGDEVFTRVPLDHRGTIAEFALSISSATTKRPQNITLSQAASIPHAALTALQSMRRADAMLSGGLRGKTVLIPGGLSGTGSIAIQLAKNVFGAGKIITTLSTAKILKAEELLGKNTIDQLVDYTKQDPNKVIGKEQIDYLYDTMKLTMPSLPIMKNGGVIVSVSMGASGKDLNQALPGVPIILRWILDMKDWYYRIRARRVGVEYRFHLATHDGNGLKDMATWIEEGKVKPIVGRTAKFSDINGIRKGCQEVFDGKGGIGKFVIEME